MSENKEQDIVIGPTKEAQQLYEDYQKMKNDYLYLAADFENYQKRIKKQKENSIKYQDEHLLTILLPFLNNLFYAAICDESVNELYYEPFIQALNSADIKVIIPSEGDIFNDETMHAISNISTNIPEENGKVKQILTPCVKIKDKIIQYAKVTVAKTSI